ncbi:MFS transporter [Chloroflexi bacterium TSY]|nr:MFS transporter [Chloroflexi bacterium TSY]
MDNYRLLTIVSALFFTAIGISSPLFTIFLHETLKTDFGQIAWILTTVVLMTIAGSYLWGLASDWLGQRKPLLVVGLLGVASGAFALSQAPDIWWAWGARLTTSLFTAAYTTLGLALMGDILEQDAIRATNGEGNPRQGDKGRRMGFYRGLGSFAFAIGAVSGGWLADLYNLRLVFAICAGLYFVAALCALLLKEVVVLKPEHKPANHRANNLA